MVNFRLVSKIISQLLFLEGAMMLICAVMAFCYREDDFIPFVVSTLLTCCGALAFMAFSSGAGTNLNRRTAYVSVSSTWAIFSLFGMLPYLIGGYIPSITDAYFETISGFTTTGATILDDVECLPHGILFWRSLTHWVGGLGIVFFTVAVLPSLVGGNMKVFAAEATGPLRSKMHPRLSTSAKWIWSIYIALTVACLLAFRVAGMDWFDSVNYSMSTTATGGFSPHNASVAYFNSPTIEYITALFMFLSGMNFTLLYLTTFKLKFKMLRDNSEFKLYISIILLSTVFLLLMLVSRMGYGFEEALRSALFQTVSFITTTGLFNDDAGAWPHISWVVLACLMFIGSSAGSTSGGFKCVRAMMIVKVIRNEFRRILHPNAVLPVKVNGQNVDQQRIFTLLSFFAVFVGMCLISATIMIMAGVDNTNAITISLSCMSNVGLSLGTQIGPEMSWSALPEGIKWVCSLLMLVGRLEIMSVLVLFTREFWQEN